MTRGTFELRSLRHTSLLVLSLSLAGAPIQAATAINVDAEERAEALRQFVLGEAGSGRMIATPQGSGVSVSGRDHPELIFRWQLFDYLLRGGFSQSEDYRLNFRRAVEARTAALGFGAQLWDQLESSSREFINERSALMGGLEQGAGSRSDEDGRAASVGADRDCTLRFQALSLFSEAIGRESLDRLLFQGVAPLFHTVVSVSEDTFAGLARAEGGCK